jgi:protease I
MSKRFLLLMAFIVIPGMVFAQQGKKALMLIAAKDFQDDEFAEPLEALKAAGVSVTVASTTLDEITGMNGAKAKADVLLKDVKAQDYDAVIFIGGSGAAQYLGDPVAHGLARDAVAHKKILGAICIAPVILANAGVITGKKATCYPTEGDNLRQCMVAYTGNPVEKDGDIITADGPKSAAQFGKELVKALSGGAR